MTNPISTVEQISPFAFVDTLSRLATAIESAGMTIFCRIDHAAAALAVGLSLPPTVVIVYGSPKGGTPVMAAVPLSALDLPLKVLVYQRADGRAIIAWHPIGQVLDEAGVEAPLVSALAAAQRKPFEGL